MSWNLSKTFSWEGRNVRHDVMGEGPPLVIVHGTPWSSYNMRHLIKGLSRQFRVYYYDLIGYGQSDMRKGDVSLPIQNNILDGLLDEWGLNNPPILGHDFGGATALRTCLLNAREFEKIVLIDPVAVSPWGSPFFRHVREYETAFAGAPDYIHEAVVRAYIKTAAFQDIRDETMLQTLKPWLTKDGKGAFYRQIAQADSSFTEEVQVNYGKLTQPVLILWGEEDTWIPLDRGQHLYSLIPGSIFKTIPNTGHLVIEEEPQLLVDQIMPFLMSD